MVTVSDLAAMGAWPAYALVSIAAPAGTDLDLLGDGLAEAAERDGLRGGGRRPVGVPGPGGLDVGGRARCGPDRTGRRCSVRGPGRATACS